jgi:hypothetical protein
VQPGGTQSLNDFVADFHPWHSCCLNAEQQRPLIPTAHAASPYEDEKALMRITDAHVVTTCRMLFGNAGPTCSWPSGFGSQQVEVGLQPLNCPNRNKSSGLQTAHTVQPDKPQALGSNVQPLPNTRSILSTGRQVNARQPTECD